MNDKIFWYLDPDGKLPFSTNDITDSLQSFHMWGYGKYWFRIGVNGGLYSPNDWTGREALENLYGESFNPKKWNDSH